MDLYDRHFFFSLQASDLPGVKSHNKVMSYPRDTAEKALSLSPPPKQSAVLLLLYPKGQQWHILLMKRNIYDGAHSGQVSLPGGKKEDKDLHFEDTALRETEEEIGINRRAISVIRKLTSLYIPPSHFIVHPYVGIVKEDAPIDNNFFNPDPHEVHKLIEMPLSFLLDEQSLTDTLVKVQNNMKIKVKSFNFENEIIWGATAMILAEFKEMILE